MKSDKFVISVKGKDTSFEFSNGVNKVSDLMLSKELGKENVQNEDSDLVISSLNNLHISDVIQVKVNLKNVGYFLANFEKEKFNETIRDSILDALAELKDGVEPTQETQQIKGKKILDILKKHKPLYISFLNNKDIKISFDNEKISFPFLVLSTETKIKKEKVVKVHNKTQNKKRITIDKKFFSSDFIFLLIFSLNNGLTLALGSYELLAKNTIAYLIYAFTVVYIIFTTRISERLTIKNNKENDKRMKIVCIIYSFIGMVLGALVGYIITSFMKTEIDYTNVWTNITILAVAIIDGFVGIFDPISPIIKSLKKKK